MVKQGGARRDKIKISIHVKTSLQLVSALFLLQDIEDGFDDDYDVEVVVDPGEELLERW